MEPVNSEAQEAFLEKAFPYRTSHKGLEVRQSKMVGDVCVHEIADEAYQNKVVNIGLEFLDGSVMVMSLKTTEDLANHLWDRVAKAKISKPPKFPEERVRKR